MHDIGRDKGVESSLAQKIAQLARRECSARVVDDLYADVVDVRVSDNIENRFESGRSRVSVSAARLGVPVNSDDDLADLLQTVAQRLLVDRYEIIVVI